VASGYLPIVGYAETSTPEWVSLEYDSTSFQAGTNFTIPVNCGDRSRSLTLGANSLGIPAFILSDNESSSMIVAPTISFDNPANDQTLPDFDFWSLDIENATSGSVMIQYGPASGYAGTNGTDTASYSPFVSVNPLPIPKSFPLFYPPLVAPVNYDAIATLYDSDGNVQAQGSIVFAINGMATGGIPSTTISTNCSYTSSSFLIDPIGNIESGICTAATYLFIPNSSEESDLGGRFTAIQGEVAQKPPFGYFGGIKTALNSFQEGNTSTLELISTSTYAAFGAIFNPIDDGLIVLLWTLFAFWIFHRIRMLEL
jgi:hypothetical protein